MSMPYFFQACFDVREASAFWSKMSVKKEVEGGGADAVQWLSTHPADEARRDSIDRRLPQLERVRALCQVGQAEG